MRLEIKRLFMLKLEKIPQDDFNYVLQIIFFCFIFFL